MPLTIFKPNSKNTGSACSWSFNSKGDKKGIFLEMIKQVSWDDTKKTGSFKGGEKVNLKLSIVEAGGFLRVLKDIRDVQMDGDGKAISSENQTAKFFHDSGESGNKGITFQKSAYMSGQKKVSVFGLSVSVSEGENKSYFKIPFDPNEAETLQSWLQFALEHIFTGIYSDDVKAFSERSDAKAGKPQKSSKKEKTQSEEVPESSPEDQEEIF